MSLDQSIRSGAKWLVLGKTGNRLIEFAFGVILARLLVPADFGMIATIAVFTGFVGMFTAGGMGQSLIRAKQADENDFTAVFTLQLAMGVLVYLGFYVTAPWIARMFDDPLYADLIRVSALSFLLRPFLVMRTAWLTREMNFKSRTIVSIVSGLFTGVISTLLAWVGMGVWSLIMAGLLASIAQNLWLARLVPLKLRLNPDVDIMRKHTGFGSKIVANDFVSYLNRESKTLLLSKLAGPIFLGLFNKAESLSRLPNQLLMSPVMEPLFRAAGKSQDDLDQVKYLYYRAITLLTVYTTPLYVLIWWIAEPFVIFVYGDNWAQAGPAMAILATAGVFLNILFPSSVILAACNRLGKEIVAQVINLLLVLTVCIIGLDHGLEGVAWGIVLAQATLALHLYWLVTGVIATSLGELVRALLPGVSLSALLFAYLAAMDYLLAGMHESHPFWYVCVMSISGGLVYLAAFIFIPIQSISSESRRWRQTISQGLHAIGHTSGQP
jgi:O-antigen/teichoic acid export membrane protein